MTLTNVRLSKFSFKFLTKEKFYVCLYTLLSNLLQVDGIGMSKYSTRKYAFNFSIHRQLFINFRWITLPLLYSDLPRTAILAITIFDCSGPGKMTTIGGTSISLFGKNSVFRQGLYDLRVWSFQEGDGNENTTTPGKVICSSQNKMQRLAKLAKMHRNGRISKIDWLDRLTFREIELINQNEKEETSFLFLMVEFPTVLVDNVMVISNCFFQFSKYLQCIIVFLFSFD